MISPDDMNSCSNHTLKFCCDLSSCTFPVVLYCFPSLHMKVAVGVGCWALPGWRRCCSRMLCLLWWSGPGCTEEPEWFYRSPSLLGWSPQGCYRQPPWSPPQTVWRAACHGLSGSEPQKFCFSTFLFLNKAAEEEEEEEEDFVVMKPDRPSAGCHHVPAGTSAHHAGRRWSAPECTGKGKNKSHGDINTEQPKAVSLTHNAY